MNQISEFLRKHISWIFLSPGLILLIAVGFVPFLYVLSLSFQQYFLAYPDIPRIFVGLDNYRELMFDSLVWDSIGLTFMFVIGSVSLQMLIGLGLAMFLTRAPIKGKSLWTPIILIPTITSPIVVGLLWLQMLNPDFGLITYYFHQLGLFKGSGPLTETSTALPTIILIDTWHWAPLVQLIISAGLLTLPREPFEAAQVDGASKWQIFTKVTVPLLRPVIIVALLIRVMDALRIFDEVWILTGGGPGAATRVAVVHAYREAILRWNMGYGSAISLFLLYIIIILCTGFYSTLRGREEMR